MEVLKVANTIREQLGNQAIVMLGAHTFLGSDDSLTFTIRGSRKVNRIQIELEASDTYTVTFFKIGRSALSFKVVAKVEQVYVDSLRRTITANTGLNTEL